MSIPKERIQSILGQFSLLFPPPVEGVDNDAVVGLWVRLFHEYDLIQFNAASWALALKLKRFPFPADFVEEMGLPFVKPAPVATNSEAQGNLLYSVFSDAAAQQVSVTLFDKHGAATRHFPPALAEQMALLILDEVAKCRCAQ